MSKLRQKLDSLEEENRALKKLERREEGIPRGVLEKEIEKNVKLDEINRDLRVTIEETRDSSTQRIENLREDKHALELELEELKEQLSRFVQDPDSRDITDLGEIYANVFDVDVEDVNRYVNRRGKKLVIGASSWFEALVVDVLCQLNHQFRGLLENNLAWFVAFLFRNEIAVPFCNYLGQYNEYRRTRMKEMTKSSRRSIERAMREARFHFMTAFCHALRYPTNEQTPQNPDGTTRPRS